MNLNNMECRTPGYKDIDNASVCSFNTFTEYKTTNPIDIAVGTVVPSGYHTPKIK